MLIRLLVGILKGLVLGALLGVGVAKLGFLAPSAAVAYVAAALTGVLVGLVAGKPIWAPGARIEAGTKAVAGAVLGIGLMYAVRRFLDLPLPLALGPFSAPNASLGDASAHGTVGGLAVTSLAVVAAVLGGFFDADNDGTGEAPAKGAAPKARFADGAAAPPADEADDEALASEAPPKRAKK